MKTTRLTVVIIGAVAIGLFAYAAQAQFGPQHGKGFGKGFGPGLGGGHGLMGASEDHLERMTEHLGLTEDQQEKIQAIIAGQEEEINALREKLKGLHDDMQLMIDGVLTDEQKARKAEFQANRPKFGKGMGAGIGRGMMGGRGMMRGSGANNPFDCIKLTEEQQSAIDAIREEKPENMREAIHNILTEEQIATMQECREANAPEGRGFRGHRGGRGMMRGTGFNPLDCLELEDEDALEALRESDPVAFREAMHEIITNLDDEQMATLRECRDANAPIGANARTSQGRSMRGKSPRQGQPQGMMGGGGMRGSGSSRSRR